MEQAEFFLKTAADGGAEKIHAPMPYVYEGNCSGSCALKSTAGQAATLFCSV